jgi:predicted RNA-binding Zn-ribbon protein involved in translation (DUF1610 family)
MSKTQNVENRPIHSNTMSNQNEIVAPLSVYIPRVFNNISTNRIAQVFHDQRLGRVDHVDFVPRVDDNEAKMAFVHFEYWNTNNVACEHLIERINDPQREARVVYEDPYYWLVLPNHNDAVSNMYNSYNMRREINNLTKTVEKLRTEFNNVNNVLDTLLLDFYEIPKREGAHDDPVATATSSSNFNRIRQEQSQQRMCPVCNVLLPPNTTRYVLQCPACQAPINADEKLIKILTTRPREGERRMDVNTNALNKIYDFVEGKNTPNEDPDDKNTESQSQGWAASWFG